VSTLGSLSVQNLVMIFTYKIAVNAVTKPLLCLVILTRVEFTVKMLKVKFTNALVTLDGHKMVVPTGILSCFVHAHHRIRTTHKIITDFKNLTNSVLHHSHISAGSNFTSRTNKQK